jgi:multicomponent Na+:H+ antiporter subunit G
MGALREIIGGFLLLGGAMFLFLGGLGLTRMPDLFDRIQAGTKATTLGTILSLAGIGALQPAWWLKLAIIAIFVLFTNPLSSQVLARAAHRIGTPRASITTVDRLAEDKEEA